MFGRLRVGPIVDAIRHPLLDQVCLIERANGAVGVGVRGHGERVLWYTHRCMTKLTPDWLSTAIRSQVGSVGESMSSRLMKSAE